MEYGKYTFFYLIKTNGNSILVCMFFPKYIFRTLCLSSVLLAVVSFLSYYRVLFIYCCFKLLLDNRISYFVLAAGAL